MELKVISNTSLRRDKVFSMRKCIQYSHITEQRILCTCQRLIVESLVHALSKAMEISLTLAHLQRQRYILELIMHNYETLIRATLVS